MTKFNISKEDYKKLSYGIRSSVKPALISYITVCVLYTLSAFTLGYSAKIMFNIVYLTTLSALLGYLYLRYYSRRFDKSVDSNDLRKMKTSFIAYMIILFSIVVLTVFLAVIAFTSVN